MPKYSGVTKTVVVGETCADRWSGIMRERQISSSVVGPYVRIWSLAAVVLGFVVGGCKPAACGIDNAGLLMVRTYGYEVAPADPAAEGLVDMPSLDPVAPVPVYNSILE